MAFRGRRTKPGHCGPHSQASIWGGLIRAVLGVLPVVLVVGVARSVGAFEGLSPEGLRQSVMELGWLGPVGLVFLYAAGIIAQVPGSVFVGGAVLAYGAGPGFVLSYLGASLGNVVSFGLVRFARGGHSGQWIRAAEVGQRRLRGIDAGRLAARLQRRPLLGVTLVRLVFPSTAAVSFALALSALGWRTYIAGSLLGVLPQLCLTVGVFAYVWDGF